jgi:glutamate-1-semialdehyde 2,1-aminomutase
MDDVLGLYVLGGGTLAYALLRAKSRLELSLAKHRSLAGHPRMARRIAALMPAYGYGEKVAFALDDAPPAVAAQRQAGFAALTEAFRARYPRSIEQSLQAEAGISDMRFVSAYRVPFQFRELVSRQLKFGSFVKSTAGVTVTDLDDNCFFDLTGSYGVNLFGNDFYKSCIAEGSALVSDLGPVLGAYHPVVAESPVWTKCRFTCPAPRR